MGACADGGGERGLASASRMAGASPVAVWVELWLSAGRWPKVRARALWSSRSIRRFDSDRIEFTKINYEALRERVTVQCQRVTLAAYQNTPSWVPAHQPYYPHRPLAPAACMTHQTTHEAGQPTSCQSFRRSRLILDDGLPLQIHLCPPGFGHSVASGYRPR